MTAVHTSMIVEYKRVPFLILAYRKWQNTLYTSYLAWNVWKCYGNCRNVESSSLRADGGKKKFLSGFPGSHAVWPLLKISNSWIHSSSLAHPMFGISCGSVQSILKDRSCARLVSRLACWVKSGRRMLSARARTFTRGWKATEKHFGRWS
jgi:hypothetical protein